MFNDDVRIITIGGGWADFQDMYPSDAIPENWPHSRRTPIHFRVIKSRMFYLEEKPSKYPQEDEIYLVKSGVRGFVEGEFKRKKVRLKTEKPLPFKFQMTLNQKTIPSHPIPLGEYLSEVLVLMYFKYENDLFKWRN